MRIREAIEHIRGSLWFVPSLSVIAAAVAALGMLALSSALGVTGSELPVVFGAGPDGARAMLQAIAGSVITVAGVTFSITIVALQLTSTQFSPRVLNNFLRDRPNQFVLGAFMGTFTYALLVLRSIRSGDEVFVPDLAITGALLLTFVSIGMLIYFIHHISVRIQVTSIVAGVAQDTLETIAQLSTWSAREEDRGWQPAGDRSRREPSPPSGKSLAEIIAPDSCLLRARQSGYLQLIDLEDLVRSARQADGRYKILVSPGSWVQRHAPIACFEPDRANAATGRPEDRESEVQRAFVLGDERSDQQDVAFGIQQLVDIGVKALSPGINDPTTAMNCVDRLVEILAAAGMATDPPRSFADADGVARLDVPFPGFDDLVPLAFEQIRHYGGDAPVMVVHVARSLSVLVAALTPERHPVLRLQASLLADAAGRILHEADRRRAVDALRPLIDGGISRS